MKTTLILALLLTGCATASPPMMWKHHAHENRATFDQDIAKCRYEAVQATGSYTPDTRGYRTMLGQDLAAAMDMTKRQSDIGMLCMKARGYSMHPVDHTAIR